MDTTWRIELVEEMARHGETFSDVVASTMTDEEMDVVFDNGFGVPEGRPFTVWTENRVYFPDLYDGSESVVSVARNPDGIATPHIGHCP